MEWIKELYNETNSIWKEYGKHESGYAIFYSPVLYNPKIMIIGYNPGGGNNSFNENDQLAPPMEHDYLISNYRLATNMKKIFAAAGMLDEFGNTVKLNLIFFRSRRADDLQNRNLIEFCNERVTMIIAELNPETIITEGFKTFSKLIGLCKGEILKDIPNYHNRIIQEGQIGKIKVIGLKHPSGARGLSGEVFQAMGENIKDIITK
jgi:uracil-DNA glycosylase